MMLILYICVLLPAVSWSLFLQKNAFKKIGIIIVDHGSSKLVANEGLKETVGKIRQASNFDIIEHAHMELSEPSISTAYGKCVEQGADFIVCYPFFLSKGRHVQEDIPLLMSKAAEKFEGTTYMITEPLGLSKEVVDVVKYSVVESLNMHFEKMNGTTRTVD